MIALIRAELLKLRTIRSTWWLAIAGAATLVGSVVVAVDRGIQSGDVPEIFGQPAAALFVTMLLAMLVATGDFRHNTATAAFLVTPRRGRVAVAKAIVVAVLGLAAAVVTSLIELAIAVPWLAAEGVSVAPHLGAIGLTLAASSAGVVFLGLLAFALAAVIRNQVASVVTIILGIFGSVLVTLVLPAVGRVLPVQSFLSLFAAGADPLLLPVWAGGLILLGWALVLGLGTVGRFRADLA